MAEAVWSSFFDIRSKAEASERAEEIKEELRKINREGRNCLHFGVNANATEEAFEVAVAVGGVDVNAQDPQGKTALILAAEVCERLVAPLLAAGARSDLVDEYGRSALHWAAIRCSPAVLRSIAKSGDVNVETQQGETALHWAAKEGREESVRVLLDSGVDVLKRSHGGKRAVDVAEEAVKELLTQATAKAEAAAAQGAPSEKEESVASFAQTARSKGLQGSSVKGKGTKKLKISFTMS